MKVYHSVPLKQIHGFRGDSSINAVNPRGCSGFSNKAEKLQLPSLPWAARGRKWNKPWRKAASTQLRKQYHWPGVQKTWRDKREYDWLIVISYFIYFDRVVQLLPGKLKLTKIDNSQCLFQLKAHWWQLCPNSNVAGPYGRQADGSKEVLPRSESAAINPRAIWGAAGSQRKQGMAWNGHQLPFFCISLHINFNETTWNNMKQHETTWNNMFHNIFHNMKQLQL